MAKEGGFYAQIWFLLGALITITILAFLLQPFTKTIVRFYEGYWPLNLQKRFVELHVFGYTFGEKKNEMK